MSSYDNWLTTEPSWRNPAIFYSKELCDDATNDFVMTGKSNGYDFAWFNFDELKCHICSANIGYYTYDNSESTGLSFREFWQMPNENLVCDDCYNIITEEKE